MKWTRGSLAKIVVGTALLSFMLLMTGRAFAVLSGVEGGNDPSRIIKHGATYYWYSTGGGGRGIRLGTDAEGWPKADKQLGY